MATVSKDLQRQLDLVYKAMNKDLVLVYCKKYPRGALLTQEGFTRLYARLDHEDRQTLVKTLIAPETASLLKAIFVDLP